jgi:hypothetical protein
VETGERLWVSGPRRSGAHNLCNRRQVETDDTVIEKEDALLTEQFRYNSSKCGK